MGLFVLITGASSGIGESACRILSAEGYEILAGVRRDEDAVRLIKELGSKVHPLRMDVTDQKSIEDARKQAQSILGESPLVAIINNAGIVVSGPVLYVPIDEWQRQFEVNVIGVIRTTQIFFNLLIPKKDDHPRRIINMSSVSGLFASPFLGPYSASKFALEALSDSLRREMYMYDIQVVIIEPGSIKTPLWSKVGSEQQHLGPEYESIWQFKERVIQNNLAGALPVESVSAAVLKAVKSRSVSNRYLVKSELWKFKLMRLLPAMWIDRIIRNKLKSNSAIRPF